MRVPRGPNSEPLSLPKQIRIRANGITPHLRTVQEALGLIDDELPGELRSLSRWAFACALLVEAETSRKKQDLTRAARQLKQALANEGWLSPEAQDAPRNS